MAPQEKEGNKIQTHGAMAQCCLSFDICTWNKLAALWKERVPIITAHVLLDMKETGWKPCVCSGGEEMQPEHSTSTGSSPGWPFSSLWEHTAPEYMLQSPHCTGSVAHSHPTLTHQHTLQVGRGKFCSLHSCGPFSRKRGKGEKILKNRKVGDGGYLKTNWLPNLVFVCSTAWLPLARETLRQASQALWINPNQGLRFDGHGRLPV